MFIYRFVEKSPLTLLDTVFMHPEPYGLVLVMGAWNFPLKLTLAPALPAIAAGNCVVLKPSEISPATSKAMADLIPQYVDTKCIKVIYNILNTSLFIQHISRLCVEVFLRQQNF